MRRKHTQRIFFIFVFFFSCYFSICCHLFWKLHNTMNEQEYFQIVMFNLCIEQHPITQKRERERWGGEHIRHILATVSRRVYEHLRAYVKPIYSNLFEIR